VSKSAVIISRSISLEAFVDNFAKWLLSTVKRTVVFAYRFLLQRTHTVEKAFDPA